jgi:hypothetical protein
MKETLPLPCRVIGNLLEFLLTDEETNHEGNKMSYLYPTVCQRACLGAWSLPLRTNPLPTLCLSPKSVQTVKTMMSSQTKDSPAVLRGGAGGGGVGGKGGGGGRGEK